jgi:hypothetical protein
MNRGIDPSKVFGFVLLSLASTTSCRHGHALLAAPVAGSGVRIELVSARARGNSLDVTIMAYNDLDQQVVINRNQIAVVGPDGTDAFRQGSHEVIPLGAHAKRPVNFAIGGGTVDYGRAPGVFLRFDGFYVGSTRLTIPPMALGQPQFGPGRVSATAAAPAPAAPTRADKRGAGAATAAAPGTAQAAPVGLESYDGPRQLIKFPGTKCAAMPLRASSVSKDVTFIVDELLLTELQQAGFEAVGPDDINAMVGFEKTKETVGCDEASCVAELGSALGVEYLVVGNLATLEGSIVLTVKLIDVKHARVLARANRMAEGGKSALPRIIAEAVQEMVQHADI